MPDELEERLRNHARSFDSLLSLIPAKLYYDEDVSEQWKRKKQTPEQKRAAKLAKLDPDNWRSAKDVMDERSAAAKRKREQEDQQDVLPDGMQIDLEKPKALQDHEHKSKKLKVDPALATSDKEGQNARLNVDEKRRQKAERKAAKQQAKQRQKDKKQRQKERKAKVQTLQKQEGDGSNDIVEVQDEIVANFDLGQIPSSQPTDANMADDASTASSSEGMPEVMSPPAESGTSSISSIQPDIPATHTKSDTPKPPKSKSTPQLQLSELKSTHPDTPREQPVPSPQPATLSITDKTAARERLSAAISTFRTQRKADINPRSRQDLLNSRRVKEEARRAAKKEQRQKENEDALRLADEELERRFSPGGSGSLLGSPRSPPQAYEQDVTNNFSFGRIAFGDGTEVDPKTSTTLKDQHKRKGPQDVTTALQAAKNKQARLAGLDEDKRKDIEEKDMWLNAKRRAHGERVKDDTSLLKKALKRQEAQKKKSEKEWTDRKDGIQRAQEVRQKKRTENLMKRRDERKHGGKKAGGSSGKKGASSNKGAKKVKRPGFEGSFRGRTGGGKKN